MNNLVHFRMAAYFLIVLLSACSSIQPTVVTYHSLPANFSGRTIVIEPVDVANQTSLEFKVHADRMNSAASRMQKDC